MSHITQWESGSMWVFSINTDCNHISNHGDDLVAWLGGSSDSRKCKAYRADFIEKYPDLYMKEYKMTRTLHMMEYVEYNRGHVCWTTYDHNRIGIFLCDEPDDHILEIFRERILSYPDRNFKIYSFSLFKQVVTRTEIDHGYWEVDDPS